MSTGPPIILISPEDTTLNMSQDAILQCQADAYPSNLTYEWLKQGQNVYHIEWVHISIYPSTQDTFFPRKMSFHCQFSHTFKCFMSSVLGL